MKTIKLVKYEISFNLKNTFHSFLTLFVAVFLFYAPFIRVCITCNHGFDGIIGLHLIVPSLWFCSITGIQFHIQPVHMWKTQQQYWYEASLQYIGQCLHSTIKLSHWKRLYDIERASTRAKETERKLSFPDCSANYFCSFALFSQTERYKFVWEKTTTTTMCNTIHDDCIEKSAQKESKYYHYH